FYSILPPPPRPTPFPYTTLFRSAAPGARMAEAISPVADHKPYIADEAKMPEFTPKAVTVGALFGLIFGASTVYLALKAGLTVSRSEEHTSELQSQSNLVCRLLLE